MKKALIDPEKCRNCAECAALKGCPFMAVFRESSDGIYEKPWVDFDKCSGCMKCSLDCEARAILFVCQPCSMHGRTTF